LTWSLCLGDKVDVFNFTFFKGNRPDRVVVSDGSGNEETSRKLRVNDDFRAAVQLFDEGPCGLAVGESVVVDVSLGLYRLGEVFLGLLLCEELSEEKVSGALEPN